jgi:glycosyltransferase involved in cell wall biosynthesis
MSKILYVSDFRKSTTGYGTIGLNLCAGLANYGYEVKALGFQYKGEEHWHQFSIVPCERMEDISVMIKNLYLMWEFDILIVGFDIPIQIKLLDTVSEEMKSGMKYIIITPLENPPITMKWAMALYPANHIFFISDVATMALQEKGVEHCSTLHVGIDPSSWQPFSDEEKKTARKVLGFGDEKVILQVCTNQERKNIPASFAAVAELKKLTDHKLRFVIVTTIDSPFGYDLNDLTERFELQNEIILLEKGMDVEQLRALYGASDCLLLLSKAEGLGLPVLEAYSMEVPMVCTDTGAMTELGESGRAYLVPPEYTHIDVFGNRKSDFANTKIAGAKLYAAIFGNEIKTTVNKAKKYLQDERPVVRMVNEVDTKIRELLNEN